MACPLTINALTVAKGRSDNFVLSVVGKMWCATGYWSDEGEEAGNVGVAPTTNHRGKSWRVRQTDLASSSYCTAIEMAYRIRRFSED